MVAVDVDALGIAYNLQRTRYTIFNTLMHKPRFRVNRISLLQTHILVLGVVLLVHDLGLKVNSLNVLLLYLTQFIVKDIVFVILRHNLHFAHFTLEGLGVDAEEALSVNG